MYLGKRVVALAIGAVRQRRGGGAAAVRVARHGGCGVLDAVAAQVGSTDWVLACMTPRRSVSL
jgi:hypothetical protein